MPDPLLQVSDVNLGFPEGEAILRHVSFSIGRGESLGLVGPSGSGKSMLAANLVGLADRSLVTSGRIAWEGGTKTHNLLTLEARRWPRIRGREIALIPQDPRAALNPVQTCGHQLRRAHRSLAGKGRDAEVDIRRALERVQLRGARTQVLAAYPHQLSGGEIQRIVIAQALLGQPELLIADEPTTALDAITSREIIELLVRLRKELGMALMFITHRRELLPLVTDRCLEIRDRAVVGAVPVLPAQETGTISKPEDQGSSHILLQTKDLSIRYEGDRYGVRECNLVLYRGRCTALVGPSGCGKSTLAAFLVGLLPGDSGVLRVGSREEVVPRDTADLLAELNAQLIFQDVGGSLNPRHTVGRAIREVSRNGATVDDVLNRVELPPEIYADRYPGQLSGGEQQRVAIARALATRPRLLICDEAFAALDRPLRQRLQLLLRKLGREDGLSILLITHDLRQVATFTDVILIMERGRIVERGTPGDVLLRPKTALGRQLAAAAGFGGGEAE